MTRASWALIALLITTCARGQDDLAPTIAFADDPVAGHLRITLDARPLATYVYRDPVVRRPFFANLRTRNGTPVTRPHPPGAGDPADHATMHPGLWLAFGDLDGSDFWRNKGSVEHVGFVEPPQGGAGQGHFAVSMRYRAADGSTVVARETARAQVHVDKDRVILMYQSVLTPGGPGPLTFGDQEEMGLGLRLATPLTVKMATSAKLIDAEGRVGEPGIRGKQASWCTSQGEIEGQRVLVTVMTAPSNVRPCWWHVRDYGLIVANPFGRAALTGGPPSRVTVAAGQSMKLEFGVAIETNEAGGTPSPSSAYRAYLDLLNKDRPLSSDGPEKGRDTPR
jgi:hypothetical protein